MEIKILSPEELKQRIQELSRQRYWHKRIIIYFEQLIIFKKGAGNNETNNP